MSDSSIQENAAAPVDPGPLDLRLWVRLLDCAKIVEKQLRRNFQLHFDTTLPRFDVLASLDRAEQGLTMSALSRSLLVSNGNVTAIVRQLQEQGLATSGPAPWDGRSAIASITEKGRAYFRELSAAHHQWVRDALDDFPVAHQTQLLMLLSELKFLLSKDSGQ